MKKKILLVLLLLIGLFTISRFTYETYKYVDNLGTTYVYRTQINNDYHLFQYYCVNENYDDTKPVEFVNTVEYIYD